MHIIPSFGPARSLPVTVISLIASAMIACMLVAQLYGYEDFATELGVLLPFSDLVLLDLTAAGIVTLELFALPYLLGMYLSPLMRLFSGIAAAAVGLYWLFVAFTNAHASNSALFASTLEVAGGIIPALWSMLLVGLVLTVITQDSRFRHATS